MSNIQKKILISVVVCTYNRADLLQIALNSLVNQALDDSDYEVLVIDNNSTDDTAEVTKSFSNYPYIRYILETNQGLSHARNRGWQEAKGQYIAYCDDDCKLPEAWLSTAKEIIETINPALFGGPIYPFYTVEKPEWFDDKYATRTPSQSETFLDTQSIDYLRGGNMFFLKTVLEGVGGFDTELGMRGDVIGYGEETALIRSIIKDHSDIVSYYHPDLFAYHHERPDKLKLTHRVKMAFAIGRDHYQMNHREADTRSTLQFWVGRVSQLAKLEIGIVVASIRMFLRDRNTYPFRENYIFEIILPLVEGFGNLYEQVKTRIQKH